MNQQLYPTVSASYIQQLFTVQPLRSTCSSSYLSILALQSILVWN